MKPPSKDHAVESLDDEDPSASDSFVETASWGGPSKGPRESRGGLYSYNNLAAQENETCGQAAIATIVDYFGLDPFHLPRVVATDGRKHFENEAFVGRITRDFPPANFFNILKCTTPEIMESALNRYGVANRRESSSNDHQGGAEARARLEAWIRSKRLPAVVLLDMPALWPNEWPYTLHWGVIYDVGRGGVSLASWHRNFGVDWDVFLRAWQCHGLFWGGLNYLQFSVWRHR